ncbi:hypothetical protein F444_05126 [Phytophthora nicotianae P1976]|uniref:Uncharacterized protein n=1 Tax=Phytophthora nicotianae P1976 TaxID=1317066 RepID=A0A081AN98_PHYNI|nr:hypothetical protein F444_05126 [Phytophthora nicotianae P1976]
MLRALLDCWRDRLPALSKSFVDGANRQHSSGSCVGRECAHRQHNGSQHNSMSYFHGLTVRGVRLCGYHPYPRNLANVFLLEITREGSYASDADAKCKPLRESGFSGLPV